MVLGKVPVPGRPTSLDCSRARAHCACSRCRGLFGQFTLFCRFSPLSPSLWETARYRLKYCLKGPLSPKQPTNQPTQLSMKIFLIINDKMPTIVGILTFMSRKNSIIGLFGPGPGKSCVSLHLYL